MSRRTFWGKDFIENFKKFSSFLNFAWRLLNFGKVFPAGLCLNCILRVYNKIFRERSFLEIYFFFHHFRSLRKIFCWSFFGGAVKSAPTCPLGKLIEKVILFEKDFLPCLDTVPKLVAFLLKFFQRRRQNCKTRVHKNVFSTKVFFRKFNIFFIVLWLWCFFQGLLAIYFQVGCQNWMIRNCGRLLGKKRLKKKKFFIFLAGGREIPAFWRIHFSEVVKLSLYVSIG